MTVPSLNCNGKLLLLDEAVVMGILNVTPDSFYDGGRYNDVGQLSDRVGVMISEGASIIDIGAMSSRPGASTVSTEEEWSRLEAVLRRIRSEYPDIIISIDTYRSRVAEKALDLGADMINDISGGRLDEGIIGVVASAGVPYVLMHMLGTPDTMQDKPKYDDVVLDVLRFFARRLAFLRDRGVEDIVIDPGFGFGKRMDDNYRLLAHLSNFQIFDHPVLAGLSRKSMIYRLLEQRPEEALNGSTALHMFALQEGARILRVHDVKMAEETIKLWKKIKQCS